MNFVGVGIGAGGEELLIFRCLEGKGRPPESALIK